MAKCQNYVISPENKSSDPRGISVDKETLVMRSSLAGYIM